MKYTYTKFVLKPFLRFMYQCIESYIVIWRITLCKAITMAYYILKLERNIECNAYVFSINNQRDRVKKTLNSYNNIYCIIIVRIR